MSSEPNAFERFRESTLFASRWLPAASSAFSISTLLYAASAGISDRHTVV